MCRSDHASLQVTAMQIALLPRFPPIKINLKRTNPQMRQSDLGNAFDNISYTGRGIMLVGVVGGGEIPRQDVTVFLHEPIRRLPRGFVSGRFLVSFLVDARGGLLESKRYPGLRFIIPPNASIGPLRVICRFLRYPSYSTQPPLNDGEGLACR
ncbi:unnamed protein product [Mesocestoides corti]|uniref:ZU5 domain-containing protein n=1 Tax=Mesocestoides corti TaxID=53468 RepID=A0A0R3UL09_MESCO|nr:unnamed protein product [Mesocestoides corti]